jgi:hypothetical protein
MRRVLKPSFVSWILLLCVLLSLPLFAQIQTRQRGQATPRESTAWEYKVVQLSYNPNESRADVQRARAYEKLLNDQASAGWELVGSILNRNNIQTAGGEVATRDTLSFVAFKRPKP